MTKKKTPENPDQQPKKKGPRKPTRAEINERIREDIDHTLKFQRENQEQFLKENPEFTKVTAYRSDAREAQVRDTTFDSTFRRAEFAFSKSEDYLRITKEVYDNVRDNREKISALFKDHLDGDLTDKLVVDPEKISDTLTEALSGKPLPADKVERAHLKITLIPLIKRMLESAERFWAPNGEKRSKPINRVLILKEPSHLAGKLLVFSERGNGSEGYNLSIIDDLFTLVRNYAHVEAGYKQDPLGDLDYDKIKDLPEGDQIEFITRKIREFRAFLNVCGSELTPEQITAFKAKVYAFAGRFPAFKNPNKKRGMNQVTQSGNLFDKSGRLNISARVAQFTGALDNMNKRKSEIFSREVSIFEQKRFFEGHLGRLGEPFSSANQLFRENEAFQSKLKSKNEVVDFISTFQSNISDWKQLREEESDLFNVEPFRTYADLTDKMYRQILDSQKGRGEMSPEALEKANQNILRLYLTSKIWGYHRVLQKLIRELKFQDTLDLNRWKGVLQANLVNLDPAHYSVQPDTIDDDFVPVMHAIKNKMEEAYAVFNIAQELNKDKREEMAESLKELDITGLLRSNVLNPPPKKSKAA